MFVSPIFLCVNIQQLDMSAVYKSSQNLFGTTKYRNSSEKHEEIHETGGHQDNTM